MFKLQYSNWWLQSKVLQQGCEQQYKHNTYIEAWKAGFESGYTDKDFNLSLRIRKYIFRKYNNQCSRCGWGERNPFSGRLPLHIDHIDGDASNTKEDNLTLLCPNCHSLTPTWGTLNMGNGRKSLAKRLH